MKRFISHLEELRRKDEISLSELEFVRYLNRLGEGSELVLGAGAAAMHFHLHAHICLSIKDISDYLFEKNISKADNSKLVKALEESEFVGDGSSLTPFVLQDQNLYLHKYWKYEEELADWILRKSELSHQPDSSTNNTIDDFFEEEEGINWQKIAVKLSHLKDLVIITGGPGTGKTFTVNRIIKSHFLKNDSLKVALAAPTGKAAQRLSETIQTEDLIHQIDPAKTIHSLLGAKGVTGEFRFNEYNKLPFDLIIIDEASMMDMNLWISLIRAVKYNAKLILLGDKNQLASVEAGSILGDICSFSQKSFSNELSFLTGERLSPDSGMPVINDCIIELSRSYRFDGKSGIKRLSESIIEENVDEVLELLNDESFPDVSFQEASNQAIIDLVERFAVVPFRRLKEEGFSNKGYKKHQILCALRKGPYGNQEINNRAESAIKKDNDIPSGRNWYEGKPVIATRNNRSLKLRNGETGYTEFNGNEYEICFEGKDFGISVTRLNDYETSFGITVHKSQGSEYDHIAIVLPKTLNRVLSKELLYTAVTRARKSVLVLGSATVISSMVQQSVVRRSGLRKKIWNQ